MGIARRPDFDRPVDLQAHLARLPPGAAAKGMYFSPMLDRLRRADPRHPLVLNAPRRLGFRDYPYAEFLELTDTAARLAWPGRPAGHGHRELGHLAYQTFVGSQVGRVLFGALGRDFGAVMRLAARGWGVSMNFGKVTVDLPGPRFGRLHFREMPAFLETLQVGIVEGAMTVCGVRGEVLVELTDLASATFEVRWE